MSSAQQKGLSSDRVHGPPPVNIDYLECSICRDILWKPIACQSCEIPFCLACISRWLVNSPTKCPNRCETYTERKCPPFIASLLARLQIACFYQANGCEKIMSYEALDKHEIDCGYQHKQCPGCETQMLKKDFSNHKSNCELIQLTCQECKLMYKRSETVTKHTENICLKKQLKRLKHESRENKREMQKLSQQLTQIHRLHPILTSETITFDDLPSAAQRLLDMSTKYKGLKWTKFSYMHEMYAFKNYPKSGYVTSFMPSGSLHIAYFTQEASIIDERPDETFTLVSLSAAAAWNDNLQLVITGYRNSIEVNQHNIILLFGRPQRILLQWKDIDKVTFKPFGGTAHPGSGESAGSQVALTQVIIDNFSERTIFS